MIGSTAARDRLARRNPLRNVATNIDIGRLHETLFVAAVTTVLVIRTQLWLTNYPQLGGGGLHIAHLLWGGLFMVLTIAILLSVLGRRPRVPAAILGGIGFGFFIDELGKFITSDNDYFFRPAAAVIYLVFVGLFMLSRYVRGRIVLSDPDRLRNAIDRIGEATHGHYTRSDRAAALELLDGVDPSNPLRERLRTIALELEAAEDREPSRLAALATAVRNRFVAAARTAWFERLVTVVFTVWAALTLLNVVVVGLSLLVGDSLEAATLEDVSLAHLAISISATAAAAIAARGLLLIRRGSRVDGYEWLGRALLVSIFVTQVFTFADSQFGAVFGLAIDIVLLVSVRLIASNERRLAGGPAPAAA